jgi:hypothetical protein
MIQLWYDSIVNAWDIGPERVAFILEIARAWPMAKLRAKYHASTAVLVHKRLVVITLDEETDIMPLMDNS